MADVTITYKGASIATMDASGTKTLGTAGKYCEDDIAVAYVKPSGGGGNALYTSGDIIIASDVSISANGTLFPGLQLSFVPDYLSIWIDKDSLAAIESPTNNHFYHIQVVRYRDTFPLVRLSGDKSSESENGWADKGFAFLKATSVNTFNSSSDISGYGVTGWADPVNTPTHTNWSLNSDGTLTMARISSAAVYLYAGTYHYIAFKEA